MYGLFILVFKVGGPLVNLFERIFDFLGRQAENLVMGLGWPAWIGSLLSDGIISGVGSVLVFFPHIALLYLGISFLQDSGYLARPAFIMDRFMHKLGLHGKSFIPMLLGFGRSIPGVMATRTLESNKDRILTILILPLMSCAARLPVYTLFAGALFPQHAGSVVFSLYVLGIIMAILMAMVFKNIFFEAKNLAYLEGVVREVARFNKAVIVAEFGWYGGGKLTYGNHAPATEEQHAQWCRKLVESTAGLAHGWLNWGFYDQPEASDCSQLSGLLKPDGTAKAWGRDFKSLAAKYAGRKLPGTKLGPRPAMDWDACSTSAAKGAQFREEYLKAWEADRKQCLAGCLHLTRLQEINFPF